MNTNLPKIHLAKYLKNNGFYTRSEIKELISKQSVNVNGKLEPLSYIMKPNDQVYVDGVLLENKPFVYYLYHKPVGIICTNNKNIPHNIVSHLNLKVRLFCVGRLDKNTSGLLILTNDGQFCEQIINASSHIEKEYVLTLQEKITDSFVIKMQQPIMIKNKFTNPAKVKVIDDYHLSVILEEGKYHQIRKLVKETSHHLVSLQRIRIGSYILGDLQEDMLVAFDPQKKTS